MVLNRHILIKLSVVFTFLSCQSQKTKNPLIERLENSIYEIETLINISDLSFSIGLGESSPFDPKEERNFKEPNQQKSNAEINTFIDSLYVNQTIIHPYNLIEIDFKNADLVNLQGLNSFYFHNNPDESPIFKPLKIQFSDGSTVDAKNNIIAADSINKRYLNDEKLSEVDKMLNEIHTSFKKHFLITESKPVKSIQFEFIRFEKNRESHTLKAKGEKIETKYGNISLENIEDKTITLKVPAVIDDNLNVEAIYKDGRILESSGKNSRTYLSDNKRSFLKKYIEVLEKAKTKVNKNKITTETQLDDYLTQQSPKAVEEINYIIKSYTFKGPITHVALTVSDTLKQSNLHTTTYNFNDDDVFVATDYKTQKKGLVDKSGNWVAKPEYSESFRKINEYFYRDQLSYGGYNNGRDYDNYYLYNPKSKTLNKFNHQLDEPTVYDNKYVKIETKTNGPIGLFDITRSKVTIPLKHSWLNYYEPNVWIGRYEQNNRIGAYLSSGKEILPHKFNTIEHNNGFLYTVTDNSNQNKRDVEDIYDVNGKNITQGKYDDIEGFFNDGLQLVVKQAFKEGSTTYIIASDYFFINKNGNRILSFSDKYYNSVQPFENGLSRIQKNNKNNRNYGFVNTKGKVVIPFMYDEASDFLGDYAYVKYKNGSKSWIGFINKNNERVLGLSESKRLTWYHKELKKHLLKTYDDSVYDFYGNKINLK